MLFFEVPLKALLPEQIYTPLKENLSELTLYAAARVPKGIDFRVDALTFISHLNRVGRYAFPLTIFSLPKATEALRTFFQVEATHYDLCLDIAALPALKNALEQVKAGTCGEAVVVTNGITDYQPIQAWDYLAKVVASLARGQNETLRPFFEDCVGNLVSGVIDLHKANVAENDKRFMIIALSLTGAALCACAAGFFSYRYKARRQAQSIGMKELKEGGEAFPLMKRQVSHP